MTHAEALKESCRKAVAALRRWEKADPGSEKEETAHFDMRMAVRDIERLTSDDAPEPSDIVGMMHKMARGGVADGAV